MQWSRNSLAFLLILALAPAFTIPPMIVSGQSYATVTTETTITEFFTYSTSTRYETGTTSRYIGAFGPVSFELNVCGLGANVNVKLNAVAGERYHVEWTTPSNLPLNLYITTNVENMGDIGCNGAHTGPVFPSATVLFSEKGPMGSVDWVAPSTGQFIVALFNFNLEAVSASWSIQGFGQTTISYTSYHTGATTKLASLTLTTAVSPLTTTAPQLGFPFGSLGLIVVGAAVAVIAGVLVVARRRKPSLGSQTVRRAVAVQSQPIISTGYADLDKALEGGIPEKFSVVIVSPSFDERDLFLRKVVQSALSAGKLAILLSNDIGRTEDMISRYAKGFYALSPQADKISSHGPNLLKMPSIENLSEASITLGIALKEITAKENATKPIMIMDILSDLLLRHKSITTRRWLTDFVGKRKAEGFTIIATLNPLTTTKEETQSIIDFFDGVIEIFERPLAERTRRFLMVRKMYGQRYSEDEMLMDKDKLF